MAASRPTTWISAGDVSAGLALAEPEPDRDGKEMGVTLDFLQREPSGLGKLVGSKGVGLSVEVHTFMPGGPHHYFADVRFPRRLDLSAAFARAGLEWPVWWVVPEVSHLIDKMGTKLLTVSGFGEPSYTLPWFVRLHAVLADTDPFEPVLLRRSVSKVPDGFGGGRRVDSLFDVALEVLAEARREGTDKDLKQQAYEDWLEREADWRCRS